MKSYKLLHESDEHFVVDEGRGPLRIAKNGLSAKLHDKIRHFADGGPVDMGPETGGETPEPPASPAFDPNFEPSTGAPITPMTDAERTQLVEQFPLGGLKGFGLEEPSQPPAAPAPAPAAAPSPAPTPTAQGSTVSAVYNTAPNLGAYGPAFKLANKAIGEKEAADTNLGNAIATEIKNSQQQLQDLAKTHADERARFAKESDDALVAYRDGKIDPRHVWDSKSPLQKVTAVIGLILGGIGSGLTHGPNLALQVIDKQIEQDIDAQKFNLNKQGNLYRMNLERLHDADSAYLQTRLEKLTSVQAMIEKAKASAMGPQATANADSARANIQMEKANIIQTLSLRQAMLKQESATGYVSSGTPPPMPTDLSLKGFAELQKARGEMRVNLPELGPQSFTYAPADRAKEANKTLPDYRAMERNLDVIERLGKQHNWAINSPLPNTAQEQFDVAHGALNLAMNRLTKQQRFTGEENSIYKGMLASPRKFLIGKAGQANVSALRQAIRNERLAEYEGLGIHMGQRPAESPIIPRM